MNKTEHWLYNRWRNIRSRCRDANNKDYANYGGRGIGICAKWDDFWLFANYVESLPGYEEGKELDRANNDGCYEEGNLRWSTSTEQNLNRRHVGKGYCFVKSRKTKPWKVQFTLNGTRKFYGYYDTEEEAIAKVRSVLDGGDS